ncbi:four helix bundle protein [Empedobacter brevis]|uniref:four helix bundle protein n=1 Tax=Empedobacter brevis TaxID=247 RepID=UPI002FE1954C
MKSNVLKDKSYLFAIRIVKFYQYMKEEKKEFIISKQVVRSGTAIGAFLIIHYPFSIYYHEN